MSLRATDFKFQSTPPSREATWREQSQDVTASVSIHAPLTGGDGRSTNVRRQRASFNPRPPHGRRRTRVRAVIIWRVFQSTPPSREATARSCRSLPAHSVSIHAPLTGGDITQDVRSTVQTQFQSTPPSREATT